MISFLSLTVISNFNQKRNSEFLEIEGMWLSHLGFLEIFVNTKQRDVTITLLLTSVSVLVAYLETDFVATYVWNVAGGKP